MGAEIQVKHNTPSEAAKYIKKKAKTNATSQIQKKNGKINRFMARTQPVPNKLM